MRSRAVLSAGVIVALVVAVWVAITAGGDDPTPTTATTSTTTPPTSTTEAPPTTSITVTPSTTTTAATTTTTVPDARVEEVRLILEDLYFRWFDAIYHNDEEAARQVVATPERMETFRQIASDHSYTSPPDRSSVAVSDVQVLLDSPTCLAVLATLDLTMWLADEEAVSTGVDVLWPYGDYWRRAAVWGNPDDLWESDCETSREDELP